MRCFRSFVLPVLEYCSALWCSVADTHLKLLDHVISCVSFFTGGVFECDRAHRRSVVELWMLHKISCNPMHPLYGAPRAVCAGACNTLSCNRTSVHFCASSLYNIAVSQDFYSPVSISVYDLGDSVFDGVGLAGFKSRANAFLLAARSIFASYCFPFLSFHSVGWYCWAGVFGLMGC